MNGKNDNQEPGEMTITESCPFCGSQNVEIDGDYFPPQEILNIEQSWEYFVECQECLATGPIINLSTSEEEVMNKAVKAWATRFTQ